MRADYNTTADSSLIDAIKRGDKHAFNALVLRHGSAVYRFAARISDDRQQIDDVVQEAFFVLWRKRRSINLVGSSALPWLLTTTKNTAYNFNRKSRRTQAGPFPPEDLPSEPANGQANRDELRWIQDEISALAPLDQRLIQLCIVDGFGYSEGYFDVWATAQNAAAPDNRETTREIIASTTAVVGSMLKSYRR
jgi:RNA polymerase sigma factor (sigma-70 family)